MNDESQLKVIMLSWALLSAVGCGRGRRWCRRCSALIVRYRSSLEPAQSPVQKAVLILHAAWIGCGIYPQRGKFETYPMRPGPSVRNLSVDFSDLQGKLTRKPFFIDETSTVDKFYYPNYESLAVCANAKIGCRVTRFRSLRISVV